MNHIKRSLLVPIYKTAAFIILTFGLITFATQALAGHHEHRFDTDSRLSGNSLENQLWQLVQNKNFDALSELISPMFLGGNALGFNRYDMELSTLINYPFKSFSITNVIESQSEDIRTIAYDFSTKGPFPIKDRRISVWHRIKHKHHQYFWQLISHSSF